MTHLAIRYTAACLALWVGATASAQVGKVGLTCTPHTLGAQALKLETQHLATFDALDFDVFTNQKWDRLHESHAQNVIVHWPDGHTTTGIERHISDLKALFVYAPDTRILDHPIRLACGNLTAVTGIFEGTFTRPLPLPDGKSIPPTGKAFRIPMATIGRWENGVMAEEFLFWDNKTYLEQIGLAK